MWMAPTFNLHFYADDTVIYCAGFSITEAKLQAVFNVIQTLNLVPGTW